MGTLPEKTVTTRRVIDASTDISNIDSSKIDWDDDNNPIVVETIVLESADTAVLEEEMRVRTAHYDDRRTRLTPSRFAAFGALSDALDEHMPDVQTRLSSERNAHAFIAVKLPDALWFDPFIDAAKTVIAALALAGPAVETEVHVAVPQQDRWSGGTINFPLDQVLSKLRSKHVVVLYSELALPAWLVQMLDVSLDLGSMSTSYLAAAVARHFGTEKKHVRKWDGMSVAAIPPNLFDTACQRAVSASHVAALVFNYIRSETTESAGNAKKDSIEQAKKTSAKGVFEPEILLPTSPKLEQLHGLGVIAIWARQFIDDIGLVKRRKLDPNDVDRGVLIEGPPGTGKTLVMQAIAASAGIGFLPTSFALWQASRGGHLGDVINAIRRTFEVAAEHAPCIVFIDELDAVPARGRSQHHDDYWRPIVNALLECLDGSARRSGVYVFAATNDSSVIDPAMLRSGRLDRRFTLGLPDEEALRGIIQFHLPDLDAAVIEPVATALAGSVSGADIGRIAREARRSARRAQRPLTPEDLLEIALPEDTRPEYLRRVTAIHEAGHAVAWMVAGRPPKALSVISAGTFGGHVRPDHPDHVGSSLFDIERELVPILAGRAAEEVILGVASSGAGGSDQSDLAHVTRVLGSLEGVSGLGAMMQFSMSVDGMRVEGRLRRLYAEAVLLVARHRDAIVALADLAMDKRVLGARALRDFARAQGFEGVDQ